jgi:universal stress protein A
MNTLIEEPKPAPLGETKPVREKLKVRTILVPIDFSAPSEKALSYAVPLAEQFHAKIVLLHVCQERFCGTEFAYLPVEESAVNWAAVDRMKSIAAKKIAPEFLGDIMVRHGVAYEEIASVAKELEAELIIVNTHGYTGLKHVLVGSTAERVIRHAPCPVLVVRGCEEGAD